MCLDSWQTSQFNELIFLFRNSRGNNFFKYMKFGCPSLRCHSMIESSFDVDISKLVTPNGDLKNQSFNVAFVLNPIADARNNCDIIVTVKIFNRWGTKVFESRDYKNDWMGTSGGGIGAAEVLPTGTYYYVITLENSGLKPIQGYILLGTDQ